MSKVKKWLERKRGWLRARLWRLMGKPVYNLPPMRCAKHYKEELQLLMYCDVGEAYPHLHCPICGSVGEMAWQDEWGEWLSVSEMQAMGFEVI